MKIKIKERFFLCKKKVNEMFCLAQQSNICNAKKLENVVINLRDYFLLHKAWRIYTDVTNKKVLLTYK